MSADLVGGAIRKALPELYDTPEQVAAALQISTRSVYRMAKKHADMPVLKLDGVLRFPRERLEKWLRAREQGRPQPRLAIVKTEGA